MSDKAFGNRESSNVLLKDWASVFFVRIVLNLVSSRQQTRAHTILESWRSASRCIVEDTAGGNLECI